MAVEAPEFTPARVAALKRMLTQAPRLRAAYCACPMCWPRPLDRLPTYKGYAP